MLAQTVREAEGEFGSRRTVVIGDFNLDPYDESVVSADGFHAVMSRSLALRKTRCVQGADHHYFYNPMWSHFGDKPQGPHGTWYWQHAEPVCWFWHILDQVLVRPELIESGLIGCDCTTIPDHAGEVSLLTSDRAPDKRRASDHLPLVFRLKCDYDSPVQERRLL
jgi:endonuclease/exonuclease/phosphatase family metal-dependent hydrolase